MTRVLKVLDVGQCDPDHSAIRRTLEGMGAIVVRAHTAQDAKRELAAGDVALVLVNRVLDADGSDGVALLGELVALGTAKVMLVSNYPEYQKKAVEMGAAPGFGKAALNEPATLVMLRRVLSGDDA